MAPTKTTLPTKCGCGGDIIPGSGCSVYLSSEDYDNDYATDAVLWAGGLGPGSLVLEDATESIMSAHLQDNGVTFDQALDILRAQPELIVVIPEDQREYQAPQSGPGPIQHD